jgi:hypothetical protein
MSAIATETVLLERADKKVWIGRAISSLVVMFMFFDGLMKVLVERHVVEAMTRLEWPVAQSVPLGLLILAITALYAAPRTAVLGAVLLTGFLGGATAVHVRLEEGAALFSVMMGVLAWAGLFLREERLRELLPMRK